MVAIAALIFVVVFAAAAVLLLGLRRWTLNESLTDARLRSPEAHRLAFVVPAGQDPAVVMAALTLAGFTSVVDIEKGTERLLIECEEFDREQVREIIEGVHPAGIESPETCVGPVHFQDEADSAKP